jgi:hypothetical protein
VTLWGLLYSNALTGSQLPDGSLVGAGSNAYESGGPGGDFARVNVERAIYQAQLPASGGEYGPIDGVKVTNAKIVLTHLLPNVQPGQNGYSQQQPLTASASSPKANISMTNDDFADSGTSLGTIVPSPYEGPGGQTYFTAAYEIPTRLTLQHSRTQPLHPLFYPALRVMISAPEPPTGFPDSVPPFYHCAWEAQWLLGSEAVIYDEAFPRIQPVTVGLPRDIRHPDTPKPMKDRIPPRLPDSESVTVARLPTGASIELTAAASNGASGAGTVTIDGQPSLSITTNGTHNIELRGAQQTNCNPSPGPALTLQATLGGATVAESLPFAVSAIPEKYTDQFDAGLSGTFPIPGTKQSITVKNGEMVGEWRGIVVLEKWKSDSGEITDLDCIQQTELARATNGPPTATSGYITGYKPLSDFLGTLVSTITPGYKQQVDQIHLFNDLRSKSFNIPVSASGYIMKRTADAKGDTFTTCKYGTSATVTGEIKGTKTMVTDYSSAGEPAGENNAICKTQKVH